jgi:hypothetical protein
MKKERQGETQGTIMRFKKNLQKTYISIQRGVKLGVVSLSFPDFMDIFNNKSQFRYYCCLNLNNPPNGSSLL